LGIEGTQARHVQLCGNHSLTLAMGSQGMGITSVDGVLQQARQASCLTFQLSDVGLGILESLPGCLVWSIVRYLDGLFRS
jgi:hypothetical protein